MNTSERPFVAARASAPGARPSNQDRGFFLDGGGSVLLGVADGLGGHPRGEVAAQLMADVCESQFRRAQRPLADPELFLLGCVGKAHHAIRRFGCRQEPPITPRTTAVLALLQEGVAHWVHVGDSRLYLFRDGEVLFQTRDHAQTQFIRQSADQPPRPRSSLTRCVGGLPAPPVTTLGQPCPLRSGDTLLLCSDGLWSQLPAATLRAGFSANGTALEHRLSSLVEQAAQAPNSDNVTAIALTWGGSESARAAHNRR